MELSATSRYATSSTKSTLTHHVSDVAVLLEHGASAFMIPAKEESSNAGGRHDFRIVHLTLVIILMMHGFQQIVTQAEDRYNFVVHGLPPLGDEMRVSPLIWRKKLMDSISGNLGYYMTVCWTPPPPSQERWGKWFVKGPGKPGRVRHSQEQAVWTFVQEADQFMGLLQGVLATCRPLTNPETLTYLHTTVSDRWHPLGLLANLNDIDHQLCDTAYTGGWYPQLGRWHLRVCSVNGYPRQSIVGILRALEALPLDFRWCTRWLGMERHAQQGVLRKAQGAWVHEEKSLTDRMSENLTHEGTRILNRDATNKAEDVDIARQEVGADLLAYGQFTSTVTVWDEDPDVADDKRRQVEWADTIEDASQQAGKHGGGDQPEPDADDDQHQAVACDQLHRAAGRRAERHAQPDLPRTLRH